jgi:hypothetical protein
MYHVSLDMPPWYGQSCIVYTNPFQRGLCFLWLWACKPHSAHFFVRNPMLLVKRKSVRRVFNKSSFGSLVCQFPNLRGTTIWELCALSNVWDTLQFERVGSLPVNHVVIWIRIRGAKIRLLCVLSHFRDRSNSWSVSSVTHLQMQFNITTYDDNLSPLYLPVLLCFYLFVILYLL